MHGGSNSYSKGRFGDLRWFVLVSVLKMCFIQLKIDVYVGHRCVCGSPTFLKWSSTWRKVDVVSRGV